MINPKFSVAVNEDPLKLDANFAMEKRKGRRDFLVETTFYKNGKEEADLEKIHGKEFDKLIKKYKNKVNASYQDYSEKMFSDQNNKSLKLNFWERLKSILENLDVATDTLNVIMIDNKEKPIARTTIELDADIITLIKKEYKSKKNIEVLFGVQGISIHLINKIMKHQIDIFIGMLNGAIRKIRILIVAIGAGVNIFYFQNKTFPHLTNLDYNIALLPQIFSNEVIIQIGIAAASFLGWKFWPNILKFLIRHIVKI